MEISDNLLFRRQFIMGTGKSGKFDGWIKKEIGARFTLYCHPELELTCLGKTDKEICLLGYILDPFNPPYTNEQILEHILDCCESFGDVLTCTIPYSGRWALIWKDRSGIRMMNDACGTRQIYFYRSENEFWCGSQPSIIAYECDLEENITPEITEFIDSPEYKKEYAWIGDGTVYDNLWHLLPNHYLDLEGLEVKRFWPDQELPRLDHKSAVKETAAIMQGTIESIWLRFGRVMLSVTAGIDSRMNLAASRPIRDQLTYIFCADEHSKRSTDYRISSRLLARLGLKQRLIGCHEENERFNDLYHKNVTMASEHPSKNFIHSFYKELPGYIHVSGVGAGIAKSFYPYDNDCLSAGKICQASKHKSSRYAGEFIEKWLKDAEHIRALKTINIYDIFYWEQRMGNWGAKSCAEQDIAIEETWPYNNRKLLSVMLSVDPRYRKPPFYSFHRKVLRTLWKETLCMPINPNFRKKTYSVLKNCLNRFRHFGKGFCRRLQKKRGNSQRTRGETGEKKILHLTYDYPDITNPDKTIAVKNITDMTGDGNNTCVISLNRTAAFGKKILDRTGNVTALTTFGLPKGIFFIVTLWASIRRVKASGTDFTAFDRIHAHKLTFEGPIAYELYRAYKTPYIITIQQTDFKVLRHKPLLKGYYFNILTHAKNIVLPSPWMKAKLDRVFGAARIKLLEHKIHSIPLIVDREWLSDEHENGRFICAFQMRNSYIKIKNIRRLLEAIRALKREGILIRLDIAGDGPASARVRHMIDRLALKDQVILLGAVENSRIVSVMSEYRAFVLCSYPETFGMVYIEALYAGIPVIYSKDAGIDGFFDDLGIGIAVRHDSVREIRSALKNVNSTPKTFRENVKKLQESGLLSQFSREAVKRQYDLIYR